jgi:hypothetical protein
VNEPSCDRGTRVMVLLLQVECYVVIMMVVQNDGCTVQMYFDKIAGYIKYSL